MNLTFNERKNLSKKIQKGKIHVLIFYASIKNIEEKFYPTPEARLAAPQTGLLGAPGLLVTRAAAHVTPEILFRFRTLKKNQMN